MTSSPHRFSPTAISMFRACRRSWGWRHLAKAPAPQSPWQARGEELHKVGEAFLLHGTAPDLATDAGKCFRPGVKFLPLPGTCVEVEELWTWDLPGEPFALTGKCDALDLRAGRIRIVDHKTTSDFKWAKDADALRRDVQAVVYAMRAMDAAGAEECDARWIYYLMNPSRPQARCVDFWIERGNAEWPGILADCREMSYFAESKVKPNELAHDADNCARFGGCPYQALCKLSAGERIRSAMAQLTLKEKLAQRAQATPEVNPPEQALAAQEAAPVQAAPPAQAALPAQPAGRVLSMKEKLAARSAKAAALPAEPARHGPLVRPKAQAPAEKTPVILRQDPSPDAMPKADLALALDLIASGLKALAAHVRGSEIPF